MVLIFKENSPTSCLLICWLTLTELLRANESLSRTFPKQQMSFSKQRYRQLLPEIFRAWCHFGADIRRQRSFTPWQRGLSLVKPAAALRGPHCSSPRPSPVCWPGTGGGAGMSVVPWPEPTLSPSLFQRLTAQGFGFCGLIMHFHTLMRLYKMWGFSVWSAELLEDFSCSSSHTGSLWGG